MSVRDSTFCHLGSRWLLTVRFPWFKRCIGAICVKVNNKIVMIIVFFIDFGTNYAIFVKRNLNF